MSIFLCACPWHNVILLFPHLDSTHNPTSIISNFPVIICLCWNLEHLLYFRIKSAAITWPGDWVRREKLKIKNEEIIMREIETYRAIEHPNLYIFWEMIFVHPFYDNFCITLSLIFTLYFYSLSFFFFLYYFWLIRREKR